MATHRKKYGFGPSTSASRSYAGIQAREDRYDEKHPWEVKPLELPSKAPQGDSISSEGDESACAPTAELADEAEINAYFEERRRLREKAQLKELRRSLEESGDFIGENTIVSC